MAPVDSGELQAILANDLGRRSGRRSRRIGVGTGAENELTTDGRRSSQRTRDIGDVEDATGLEGAWDFTLSFSPPQMLQRGRGRLPGKCPTPPSRLNRIERLRFWMRCKRSSS
jgi:hypothetical protein